MDKKLEIAVRLFENQLFGTTYGKGLRRAALYNATAEIKSPHAKYLLDFYNYDRWQHTATDEEQITVVNEVEEMASGNTLFSWVQFYDKTNKTKRRVTGCAVLQLDTQQIRLLISDAEMSIDESWVLPLKVCKSTGSKNSPQLLATNTELVDVW